MLEIVDQATGLLSKMSSGSNGLFQETTKEEREEAERKLNGIKANPYIVPATEQQNSLAEYHTEKSEYTTSVSACLSASEYYCSGNE